MAEVESAFTSVAAAPSPVTVEAAFSSMSFFFFRPFEPFGRPRFVDRGAAAAAAAPSLGWPDISSSIDAEFMRAACERGAEVPGWTMS